MVSLDVEVYVGKEGSVHDPKSGAQLVDGHFDDDGIPVVVNTHLVGLEMQRQSIEHVDD